MNIIVTSRHFKAHESLNEYAERSVNDLASVYNGIVRAEVILSFEKARNSVKVAEINLKVYGTIITAVAKSDDFFKSIEGASAKVLVQLKKYKDKLHKKNRTAVLKSKAKE
ncbi:MAG: ribosome-associated translation inhibitor RaiA [Ignavibacteriales bacterium]|nr:ribosome-associated translation inhibitor RaiA [Ignavibacteriales bacterium]